MGRDNIWDDFASLPAEAQQQVAEFIASLRARYELRSSERELSPVDLADEPFVGMWRDRPEMQDSSQWVRKVRRTEWRLMNG